MQAYVASVKRCDSLGEGRRRLDMNLVVRRVSLLSLRVSGHLKLVAIAATGPATSDSGPGKPLRSIYWLVGALV